VPCTGLRREFSTCASVEWRNGGKSGIFMCFRIRVPVCPQLCDQDTNRGIVARDRCQSTGAALVCSCCVVGRPGKTPLPGGSDIHCTASDFPLPTSHFSLLTSRFPSAFSDASAAHFARGLPSGGSEGHFPRVQHWKLNQRGNSVRLKNLGTALTGGLTSPARLPTSHFPLPTSHFPLPTSHFPLPTSHFSLPTSHFQLPTSNFPIAFPNASAVIFARGLPSGGSIHDFPRPHRSRSSRQHAEFGRTS
jgi:hypothetical protein